MPECIWLQHPTEAEYERVERGKPCRVRIRDQSKRRDGHWSKVPKERPIDPWELYFKTFSREALDAVIAMERAKEKAIASRVLQDAAVSTLAGDVGDEDEEGGDEK